MSLLALSGPLLGSRMIPELSESVSLEDSAEQSADFWEKIRADYKLKPDYINLENGYYNIIPQPTLEKMMTHAQEVNYQGAYYMRRKQWDNKQSMVDKLAETVGCEARNLIITRNTTESLNTVIKGFPWSEGDGVIYAEQDYGAMRDMFKQVSARFKLEQTVVSVPNHPDSDEAIVSLYEQAIKSNTKLLMICHMINITGHILPVRKICDMAHRYGVQVMVDGAHCIGHLDFSIAELNCDYYGSSLHKWLAAPLGTGLLYVRDEHIDVLWPLFAESERDAGDISRLNHTGTHPVYHDLTIGDAIDYYNAIGARRKEDRLRFLNTYWTKQLEGHPGIVWNTPSNPQRYCAIANVGVQGITPRDLDGRRLEDYRIYTVAIDSANVRGCRITPNVYTTTAELDTLVYALKTLAS